MDYTLIYPQVMSYYTGIFMTGGDQSRVVRALTVEDREGERVDTPVLSAMRDAYEQGWLTISGTSAGAAVMTGAPMVTGGRSYQALVSGVAPFDGEGQAPPLAVTYDPLGGIGLFPEAIIDTHFGHRGRQGRLIRLLSDTVESESKGSSLGIGLDEATALVITTDFDGRISGEVVGDYGVFLADVSEAEASFDTDNVWGIQGVRTHYLTNGDFLDISEGNAITFGATKDNLSGKEHMDKAPESQVVFAKNQNSELPGEYVTVSTGLLNS